jgi:hypothetical protein
VGLGFSTTSASYFLSQNGGGAFSTTSALFFSSVGLAHSTTSVAYQLTQPVILGNATSTTFFATTASSTNLFSNTATIGSLTAGSLTLGSPLSVANGGTGSTTLTGLLKGNGVGGIQTAIAGTDYVNPTGLAAAFPFTGTSNYGATASATSPPMHSPVVFPLQEILGS